MAQYVDTSAKLNLHRDGMLPRTATNYFVNYHTFKHLVQNNNYAHTLPKFCQVLYFLEYLPGKYLRKYGMYLSKIGPMSTSNYACARDEVSSIHLLSVTIN